MYLTIGTSPNLSFAVGKLAHLWGNPTPVDWIDVKRVQPNVKAQQILCFVHQRNMVLIWPVQRLWLGRGCHWQKSFRCLYILKAWILVSWCPCKQAVVPTSTFEAKYIFLTVVRKEALWLKLPIGGLMPAAKIGLVYTVAAITKLDCQ